MAVRVCTEMDDVEDKLFGSSMTAVELHISKFKPLPVTYTWLAVKISGS